MTVYHIPLGDVCEYENLRPKEIKWHYAIAFKKYFKRMNILKEVFRDQLGKTIRMKVHATGEYKTFDHIVERAWNISSNCSHIDYGVK